MGSHMRGVVCHGVSGGSGDVRVEVSAGICPVRSGRLEDAGCLIGKRGWTWEFGFCGVEYDLKKGNMEGWKERQLRWGD